MRKWKLISRAMQEYTKFIQSFLIPRDQLKRFFMKLDFSSFRYEMCLSNRAVVRCSGSNKSLPSQPESTCVFSTILDTNVTLGNRCVVEYSSIESGVTISDGSIVSNMMVTSGATIPPGCFLHTVCVMVDKHDGLFVTVVFGIKDNVKKVMPIEKMNVLKYFGQPMDVALKSLAIKQEVNISIFQNCNEQRIVRYRVPVSFGKAF